MDDEEGASGRDTTYVLTNMLDADCEQVKEETTTGNPGVRIAITGAWIAVTGPRSETTGSHVHRGTRSDGWEHVA